MRKGPGAIISNRSKLVVVIANAYVETYILVVKYKLWAVDKVPVIPGAAPSQQPVQDEQDQLVTVEEDSLHFFKVTCLILIS